MLELLTREEMSRADALTVAAGRSGLQLMEAAGGAVVGEVVKRFPDCGMVAVLAGPGNNGGDGFAAARQLSARGISVKLALLGPRERLKGDAATMAQAWQGAIEMLEVAFLEGADVIVDAVFGAGLTRPLEGEVAGIANALDADFKPVIAVDVPSGLDGTTGEVRGAAIKADATVTFFRRKPGHLLLPGRLYCGEVTLADIGIEASVLDDIAPLTFANDPALWIKAYRWPKSSRHKYDRGHAVAVSGPVTSTGAGRLAARAALRAGAGLVTLASPGQAFDINASQLTAIMIAAFDDADGLSSIMRDERKNAALIGPGAGVGEATRANTLTLLDSAAHIVLDADALTAFSTHADTLFEAVAARKAAVVLTPHEGEFARLFPSLEGSKLVRAQKAAASSGAIILLKGADTVIAEPGGRVAINENAPPWLASAGTGDVLAGFVLAHLAQDMGAFEAAAAAAWLHGAVGEAFGPGLIAEDLPEILPRVLRGLTKLAI